jgi:transcription antitermination factor NusG
MNMYVLQIKPGFEESAAKIIRGRGYTVLCPSEELYIRRGGEWLLQKKLIFTQYLFVECDLTDESYYRIRSADGVIRFLGFGKPEKLPSAEALYIKILDNDGNPIEASKVYTTAAGAKMVLSGVLRNYVDNIVSLDLRQRRAKIKVELFGVEHKITLPVIGI